MRAEMKEFERIMKMDEMISSGTFPTIERMMNVCGTSRATCFRDLQKLQDTYHAPLVFNKYKDGYEYTEHTFRIPAVLSSEKQIKAARAMQNLLDILKGTPVYDEVKDVFKTLATVAPKTDYTGKVLSSGNLADDMNGRKIFLGAPNVAIDKEMWETLNTALEQNRHVMFDYKTVGHKNTKSFSVQPYQLIFDAGNWNLWAYDVKSKSCKLFTLSEMSNVELHKGKFTLPKDFDFRNTTPGTFGCYTDTRAKYQTFKIELYGYIATRAPLRIWGENQTIEETSDGIILSFDSNQYLPILTWVLSWGADAIPIEPSQLVDDWQYRVEAMYEASKGL